MGTHTQCVSLTRERFSHGAPTHADSWVQGAKQTQTRPPQQGEMSEGEENPQYFLFVYQNKLAQCSLFPVYLHLCVSCNGDILRQSMRLSCVIVFCGFYLHFHSLVHTLLISSFFACFNLGLWRSPLFTTITFQLLLWSVERYVALMVFIEPCPTIHILAGVYVGSL